MFRFAGRMGRKAIELATRRILREALASAIVTIVVTAAFTGFVSRSEPPMPPALVRAMPVVEPVAPAPRAEAVAAAPAPAAAEFTRAWFDPKAVTPNPTGFRHTTATVPAHPPHRRAAASRQAPVPPSRPIVQASLRGDDKALGHGRTPDALATASPAHDKRFRVWGVAPGDLIPSVPSASSILKGVKSVGGSVVALVPSL